MGAYSVLIELSPSINYNSATMIRQYKRVANREALSSNFTHTVQPCNCAIPPVTNFTNVGVCKIALKSIRFKDYNVWYHHLQESGRFDWVLP